MNHHQFKPGDLALIVKDNHPENIGRSVELLFVVADGEVYRSPSGCKSKNTSGGPVWIVSADELFNFGSVSGWEKRGWTQKSSKKLIPLRGDFTPEQQKAKEAEPCA